MSREEGRARRRARRPGRAGSSESTGGDGGDTPRSCGADNQTLYCLSYIRRQHCKTPVEKRGNSRSVEVVEVCNSQKVTYRRDHAEIVIRKKSESNTLAK